LSLWVVSGGLLLAACGSAPTPTGAHSNIPAQTSTAAQSSSAAQVSTAVQIAVGAKGSAGVKAFIDPVTGELRAPSAEERRAAAATASTGTAAATGASVRAAAPIEGRPIGNGIVEFDVGKRGTINEVACVQADGTVSGNCPKSVR
jgi:hypothetical protein